MSPIVCDAKCAGGPSPVAAGSCGVVVWMTALLLGQLLPVDSHARLVAFHVELLSVTVIPVAFVVTVILAGVLPLS